ncbi:MAG: GNAT family N-acetyltransferase [Candidatus Falkowbacteria bacterium]
MIKDNSYNTRDVKREDSKRVWEIRNHPIARQYSGSSEEIPFENHDPWFEKKYFVCEENYCFIMEDSNNYVIGYCRFDFDDENDNYIISIAVDPDCQGKGLGHKLLSESLEKFNIEKDILAEISKINIASIKLFEKSNFKEHKEDEENYYLKYNF